MVQPMDFMEGFSWVFIHLAVISLSYLLLLQEHLFPENAKCEETLSRIKCANVSKVVVYL